MGLDARLRREEVPKGIRDLLWDIYKTYSPRRVKNFAIFYCREQNEFVLYAYFGLPRENRGLEVRVSEVEGAYNVHVSESLEPFKAENI